MTDRGGGGGGGGGGVKYQHARSAKYYFCMLIY